MMSRGQKTKGKSVLSFSHEGSRTELRFSGWRKVLLLAEPPF